MDWWQIALLILFSVVLGLIAGRFLGGAILRFRENRTSGTGASEEITGLQETNSLTSDLTTEIEANLKIAASPCDEQLLPFQTQVWDNSHDKFYTLPSNIQQDLTQIYVDLRLANSVVWLSTEVGRRNNDLDESYLKLRANIAIALSKVLGSLKQ